MLSQGQSTAINFIERTGASISVIGIAFIVVTYIAYPRLRTTPNLFVLLASVANIGNCIAGLIGLAAVDELQTNDGQSNLCQAQAFLLEWFQQADPFWSLSMALNVYMVFFHSVDPAAFRKYIWVYCFFCFGTTSVPAWRYLFTLGPSGNPMYGDATIWCWIGSEDAIARLYTFFLPVWLAVAISILIYIAVGIKVFRLRNKLASSLLRNTDHSSASRPEKPLAISKVLSKSRSFHGRATITTDVEITRSEIRIEDQARDSTVKTHIASTAKSGFDDMAQPITASRAVSSTHIQKPATMFDSQKSISTINEYPTRPEYSTQGSHLLSNHHVSAYAAHDSLHSTSGVHLISSPNQPLTSSRNKYPIISRFNQQLRVTDPVKAAYLRTSFVFTMSLLVTWAPSSVNCVYHIMHPDQTSFGLNVATAIVLPLQGAWNALIYVMMSRKVLRELWLETRGGGEGRMCGARQEWGGEGGGRGGGGRGGGNAWARLNSGGVDSRESGRVSRRGRGMRDGDDDHLDEEEEGIALGHRSKYVGSSDGGSVDDATSIDRMEPANLGTSSTSASTMVSTPTSTREWRDEV